VPEIPRRAAAAGPRLPTWTVGVSDWPIDRAPYDLTPDEAISALATPHDAVCGTEHDGTCLPPPTEGPEMSKFLHEFTPAEVAAGRALFEAAEARRAPPPVLCSPLTWERCTPRAQITWIEDAMTVVHAWQGSSVVRPPGAPVSAAAAAPDQVHAHGCEYDHRPHRGSCFPGPIAHGECVKVPWTATDGHTHEGETGWWKFGAEDGT